MELGLNLNTVEIKAFVPAKDFTLSKRFYSDLGFNLASDSEGIAYFFCGNCSFLLQDFYEPPHANNFMMHLLVESVDSWHKRVVHTDIATQYGVEISEVKSQPWGMRDFILSDPSGVLWRVAENV